MTAVCMVQIQFIPLCVCVCEEGDVQQDGIINARHLFSHIFCKKIMGIVDALI